MFPGARIGGEPKPKHKPSSRSCGRGFVAPGASGPSLTTVADVGGAAVDAERGRVGGTRPQTVGPVPRLTRDAGDTGDWQSLETSCELAQMQVLEAAASAIDHGQCFWYGRRISGSDNVKASVTRNADSREGVPASPSRDSTTDTFLDVPVTETNARSRA